MKAENRFLISSAFLIIAGAFSACHSSDEDKNKGATTLNLPNVVVTHPQIREMQNSFELAGEAMANQQVKLFAMEDGYVKQWTHDIGDMVRKNEVLAVLVNPDIIQQQEKAQAELEGDAAIYKRFDEVYKKTPELVPLEQVDEAKAKYGSAQAALDAINSRITYLTVRAPFDGMITSRYVDTGAIIQNGLNTLKSEPLFEIKDISIIRVNVPVPEINSPSVTKGTPVKVTFVDLPNTIFNGKVSRISYGLNQDTRTMLAQIDLSNKNHLIHPGMFANVQFMVSVSDSALSIPNEAIGSYEQQNYVYKAVPVDSTSSGLNWDAGVKCIVKKVFIQLGIRSSKYSQINYSLIKPGDNVVVSGNALCADGSVVIAKTEKNK